MNENVEDSLIMNETINSKKVEALACKSDEIKKEDPLNPIILEN